MVHTLAGLLLSSALVACAVTATAAGDVFGRASSCTHGAKPAIIAGNFKCLKVGQVGNAKFNRAYARYGFECDGLLEKKTIIGPPKAAPKVSTTTSKPVPTPAPGTTCANPLPLGTIGSTGAPWLNEPRLLGAANVSYPQSNRECGVAPSPQLTDFNGVFPGGSATGNYCVQVQATDVPTLVAYGSDFGTIGPWFAVH